MFWKHLTDWFPFRSGRSPEPSPAEILTQIGRSLTEMKMELGERLSKSIQEALRDHTLATVAEQLGAETGRLEVLVSKLEDAERWEEREADLLRRLLEVRDALSDAVSRAGGGLGGNRHPRWWHPFSRKRNGVPEAKGWIADIEVALSRLDRILGEERVLPIPCVGEPYDPTVARAVAFEEAPGLPAGAVSREILRGYRRYGEVLRKADVAVTPPDPAGPVDAARDS